VIRLFCGFDDREAIGFHVFVSSVLQRASLPVCITPLHAEGLPQGSNTFTLSRFLVPYYMNWQGRAIFMDGADMLLLDDIAKLESLFDDRYAVQVVKHERYATRHKIKYRGTDMECPNVDYPRKNWASVMLINCEHPMLTHWNPAGLASAPIREVLQFTGIPDDAIGELPDRWNRLVDEGHPVDNAAVCHWTAGIPGFPRYRDAPGADLWHAQRRRMEASS
jgi:hypothetical protein